MRRLFHCLTLLMVLSCGQTRGQETPGELRTRVFDLAKVQAVYMDSLLAAQMPGPDNQPIVPGSDRESSRWRCPRTFQGDTLVTSDIGWWCSGFYPGVLWQVYGETGDVRFRELAVKHTLPLAGLLERETDHDIGFQLMSGFGRWLGIDAGDPREEDALAPSEIKAILEKGAETLAARFIPEAGILRSWNGNRWNIPVIIDNMMNLELLMAYGDRTVAEKHALTTMENHFREDGTAWHLVDYADDGTILGKQTVQGYADDTAWARAQAWALYGYAAMAEWERKAGDTEKELIFRRVAGKLESWLLENLPEDGIPYWDFSQSDYRDASAGAIIACGLLKMWKLNGMEPEDPGYRMALRILGTLASPEYLAEPRTNGGFLLKHSVGNLPGRSEVDVPLTYADYYFLEALSLLPR